MAQHDDDRVAMFHPTLGRDRKIQVRPGGVAARTKRGWKLAYTGGVVADPATRDAPPRSTPTATSRSRTGTSRSSTTSDA